MGVSQEVFFSVPDDDKASIHSGDDEAIENHDVNDSIGLMSNLNPQSHALGVSFATYNSRGVVEDLFPDDASSNDEEEFSNKKSKRRIKKDSARRCPPGLRKIARQVINIIRASQRPMTYKEISELVTERSKSIILRNARKGNCSIS